MELNDEDIAAAEALVRYMEEAREKLVEAKMLREKAFKVGRMGESMRTDPKRAPYITISSHIDSSMKVSFSAADFPKMLGDIELAIQLRADSVQRDAIEMLNPLMPVRGEEPEE